MIIIGFLISALGGGIAMHYGGYPAVFACALVAVGNSLIQHA